MGEWWWWVNVMWYVVFFYTYEVFSPFPKFSLPPSLADFCRVDHKRS